VQTLARNAKAPAMMPDHATSSAATTPASSDITRIDILPLARRLLFWCVAAIGVLVVLDIAVTWRELISSPTLIELFNTANEENIPTWCSATFFFLTGSWAFLAWWGARCRNLSRSLRCGLLLAAVLFPYFGLDDTVEIHERLGTIFADMHGGEDAQESYGWQHYILPVYLVAGVSVLVLVGPELRRRRLLGWFLCGGVLMAFGQGLDRVEGYPAFAPWSESVAAAWSLEEYDISHAIRLTEEVCEMLGCILVGQSFLRLLALTTAGMLLRLGGEKPKTVVDR
jgi:hypothetical protein